MTLPKAPLDAERAGAMNAYARYASLGIQFAVAMCFFGWVGWWLDGKLSTYPLLLIVGLFLGATGGFVSLVKAIPPAGPRRELPRDDPPPKP